MHKRHNCDAYREQSHLVPHLLGYTVSYNLIAVISGREVACHQSCSPSKRPLFLDQQMNGTYHREAFEGWEISIGRRN